MQRDMKEAMISELTDDEKIDIAAEHILRSYLPAFAELANGGERIQEEQ